ncbi:MAG: GtrA family protein [Burkholderiales bacterium]|nr:GtrA family protein [Burkholderiales bacterium]
MNYRRFFSFALVGGVGFIVDAGILLILNSYFGLDPLLARIPSFLCAVTATWILNSYLTFRSMIFSWSRWLAYTSANSIGFLINFSVFALLTSKFPLSPVIAIAIASVIALAVNFLLSLKWVFKNH